jgi:hypothetical protein
MRIGTRDEPEGRSGPLTLFKRGHSIVWVRIGTSVDLLDAPGGDVLGSAGAHTKWGSRTVFSVVRQQGDWAGVLTPLVGNGRLAWVKLDSAKLKAGFVRDKIVVDLSDYEAQLLRGHRVVRSFGVAIGAPASPTPLGRFAVTDTFRGDINPAYGCCAVALTAVQPYLPSGWYGGNRIAIHGAPGGSAGVAVSHGCVHAADSNVGLLVDKAPPGTPVVIRE